MSGDKKTLALQAFLNMQQEKAIIDIWQRVLQVDGVDCALRHGAIPHITIASWQVTEAELQQSQNIF